MRTISTVSWRREPTGTTRFDPPIVVGDGDRISMTVWDNGEVTDVRVIRRRWWRIWR